MLGYFWSIWDKSKTVSGSFFVNLIYFLRLENGKNAPGRFFSFWKRKTERKFQQRKKERKKKEKEIYKKEKEIPPMQKLTAKQEAFAQYIGIHGLTQSEAYKTSYGSTMVGNSLQVAGYQTANLNHVSIRIEELRQQRIASTVKSSIADIVERKENATEIMRDKKERARDRLFANKLIGDYERDFVQQIQTVSVNMSLTEYTPEELKLLLLETRERRLAIEGDTHD
jgi:hypothetical protein